MATPAFIRHSPEREAAIQRRLLDKLEGQFRRKIAATIREESGQLIRGYENLGYVPAATDDDFRAFRDLYMEIGLASARTFGSRIVSQGKAAGLLLETKISFTDLFRSLAMAWVNQEAIRRRITYVTENTRERIVRQVAMGQDEGLGVEAIAKRINQAVPKISRTRGALIARTETHGAANYAMHETAKTTGLDLVKEWVSVEDARTRRFGDDAEYNHLRMNGQQREMDEPFAMPWIKGPDLAIMYPGEAGKPGAATINCRCSVVHSVKTLDAPQTSVAAQEAAQGRPMTVAEAISAKPILAKNYAGSLDAAPQVVGDVISKAPDLNGMISGAKGAYATHDRKISMGRHVKGSPEYDRVFRHEFGHTVDRELGATEAKLYKSFDAVKELATDTDELDKLRTGMFMGDKAGSVTVRKTTSRNLEEFNSARMQMIIDADGDGYANDARAVVERLTPLKYDDVLKMYEVDDISPNIAFDFAAAWKKRDAYELLHNIGRSLGSRPTHKSAFAGMQDTFEAGTAGKIRIAFGHGEKYYKDRLRGGPSYKQGRRTFGYGSTAEAFANWFEAYASPNKADYQTYQMLWPRTSRAFEKMLEDYVND